LVGLSGLQRHPRFHVASAMLGQLEILAIVLGRHGGWLAERS
jgi:hypothetical protein